MNTYKESFARMEKKYVLSKEKMMLFLNAAGYRIIEDEYPHSVINSIYFDSIDNKLIQTSLEKPEFKEKIRLRSYSAYVNEHTKAFAEIKRKVNGKVYKRRIDGSFGDLFYWLNTYGAAKNDSQISKEIAYLRDYYRAVIPSMQIGYRRDSYVVIDNPALRITFDTDVIWRNWDLNNNADAYGVRLLEDDVVLMEIKVSGNSIPIWICRMINEFEISASSISKYGVAYINSNSWSNNVLQTTLTEKRNYKYA